ncbi:YqiJ family protein [Shewanella cyperi]|uniref:DUF1449 family protein n=1 Tax=Shewanella cyperi TaxID=2814292 RepID=A0A974XJ72_9GAMM|nr:YqiJ family protein [Shewanella cyperi]QSX29279.1 DUF1449 family protein [Shewanella cyperi]QSX40028.1 DUF1449 family protein [Shewanella cyperi]
MLSFLFSDPNLPYSIAIAMVVLLGIIEALAMVAGLSIMGVLDDWLPMDNDFSADVAGGGFTGLVGWLCLNRLPLLIWLVLALCSFAISGLSINFVSVYAANVLLPTWLTLPLALFGGALGCRLLGQPLARLLPKNESSAVSIDDLCGCVGTVTLGRAVKGNPSEALVHDKYQQKHYVLVEPEHEQGEFLQGTSVVLLRRQGRVWAASPFEQTQSEH